MTSVVFKSINRPAIEAAVAKYAAELRERHPEVKRVIWFGSWVNGIPTPRSDVDLCVVLTHSEKRIRDRIPDYLPRGFPTGVDLFPYTESELERLRADSPSWYAAISKGREV